MNWKTELLEARSKWMIKTYQAAKDFGVPVAKPYSDKKTNALTKAVYDWLKFHGHYANRINVQGQARVERVECFGNKVIEKVHYTPGTTNKGTADIDSIINGKPVKIEIKCKATRDRMRPDQWKEKQRIEAAGGFYLVVTDMENFTAWYNSFVNE